MWTNSIHHFPNALTLFTHSAIFSLRQWTWNLKLLWSFFLICFRSSMIRLCRLPEHLTITFSCVGFFLTVLNEFFLSGWMLIYLLLYFINSLPSDVFPCKIIEVFWGFYSVIRKWESDFILIKCVSLFKSFKFERRMLRIFSNTLDLGIFIWKNTFEKNFGMEASVLFYRYWQKPPKARNSENFKMWPRMINLEHQFATPAPRINGLPSDYE